MYVYDLVAYIFLIRYIGQICIMLCADHGPCVSGAHNTIVTARAGKDLVSSLVSGKYMPLICQLPVWVLYLMG